jgi:hypothetical protein
MLVRYDGLVCCRHQADLCPSNCGRNEEKESDQDRNGQPHEKTSRSALERLLDPENASITLITLERAASALGKKLTVQLA